MDRKAMREVMKATEAGEMTFPEVVGRLTAVGVESYLVDFAAGRERFYLVGGETAEEPMTLDAGPIAEEFSKAGLIAAIRGAQADTIRYPEFVQRAVAAGVMGYRAFLAGCKVVYFGRKGEMHVEDFAT